MLLLGTHSYFLHALFSNLKSNSSEAFLFKVSLFPTLSFILGGNPKGENIKHQFPLWPFMNHGAFAIPPYVILHEASRCSQPTGSFCVVNRTPKTQLRNMKNTNPEAWKHNVNIFHLCIVLQRTLLEVLCGFPWLSKILHSIFTSHPLMLWI